MIRLISADLLATIQRHADSGQHNYLVLLRLANTIGIPQGADRLVSSNSPLAAQVK